VPTLIFGAEVVKRGARGWRRATPLALLAAITAGAAALLPFAAAARNPHQSALAAMRETVT
jgi:heme exporter protein B